MAYEVELDLAEAKVFNLYVDAETVVTWEAIDDGANSFTLILQQSGDGGNVVTFDPPVLWADSTPPTFNTDPFNLTVLTFFSADAASAVPGYWFGFVAGESMGVPT